MTRLERELAASLDADEALLPFVPLLLQGLWSLGFSPEPALRLLGRNVHRAPRRMLDLGCGKGALLIHLAHRFGWRGRGVDIVPEFIAEARGYADAWQVADAVEFAVRDMADELAAGGEWDLVLFGFDSEALGDLPEALARIEERMAPSGHLMLDLAWARPGGSGGLPDEEEVLSCASALELRLVDREVLDPSWVAAEGLRHLEVIRGRARDLASTYPMHAAAFERYVLEQENENLLLREEAHCGYLLFARSGVDDERSSQAS